MAWQKGESGNPNGRPRNRYSITAFLREIGEEPVPGEDGLTRAKRLARKLWDQAEDGDRQLAQYLVDRLDGKPKERIEQEGETVVRIVFEQGNTEPVAGSGEVLEQPGEVSGV